MKYFIVLFLSAFLLYSCGNNDVVAPPVTEITPLDYTKIFTAESGSNKFEVYSASGNTLFYGHNEIGFRVYVGGVIKKTGFVKFNPQMYHGPGGPSHSSPVSERYTFNNDKNLFTGYAVLNMISDSTNLWYGSYNYNNEANVDSVMFVVNPMSSSQIITWDDMAGGNSYVLTLLYPKVPRVGLNTYTCLLHRTTNEKNYFEVDSAGFSIKPWMEAMGHGSPNNVNPASLGGGRYEGMANFSMSGQWSVRNTLYRNGVEITPANPAKFYFDAH